jgi:dethiobiotin synthetase
MAPIGEDLTTMDVVRAMRLPVILVVGLRLGCVNHALLTASAIRHAGIPLTGWVANQIDPAMTRVEENIDALEERIEAPLLARFPHQLSGNERTLHPFFPIEKLIQLTPITD